MDKEGQCLGFYQAGQVTNREQMSIRPLHSNNIDEGDDGMKGEARMPELGDSEDEREVEGAQREARAERKEDEDEEGEEGIQEDDFTCVECAPGTKFKSTPNEPSKREREEHNISHMPYRSWCSFCVREEAFHPITRQKDQKVMKISTQRLAWTTCS